MRPRPILLLFLACMATAAPARKRLAEGHDPGQLAWNAWLLMDRNAATAATASTASSARSAPAPETADGVEVGRSRRISSRAIFFAQQVPTTSPRPSCGEGYRANTVGGCHLVINIGVAVPPPTITSRPPGAEKGLSKPSVPEGSGEPPESGGDDLAVRLAALRFSNGKRIRTGQADKNVYSVTRQNDEVGRVDKFKEAGTVEVLTTSSEFYRHMLPIIRDEEDEEIKISRVRLVGGFD